MPAAHHHLRAARHCGMHGVLRKPEAIDTIVGIGPHAADQIARVDVLEIQLHARRREVLRDPGSQQQADVVEFPVAGGIEAGPGIGDQVLAGSFRSHDHGMAAPFDSFEQVVEQTVRTVQLKGHLRDEHIVGVGLGERRVAGDEAGMAAHQLHEAHAVGRGLGLDMRRLDRLRRLTEGGLKAEALVDEGDVVVDRLGDTDDGDLAVTGGDRGGDLHRPPERAVTADHEQRIDIHSFEAVDDLLRILPSPRRAQDRAAILVDVADHARREFDHVVGILRHEALVAVAEAVDLLHAVVKRELHDDAADHVVDARTEAAAGDDAHPHLGGVEEDLAPRAGRLESGELIERAATLPHEAHRVVKEHAVVLPHVVHGGAAGFEHRLERRVDPAGTERFHDEIGGGGHWCVPEVIGGEVVGGEVVGCSPPGPAEVSSPGRGYAQGSSSFRRSPALSMTASQDAKRSTCKLRLPRKNCTMRCFS